MAAWFALCLLIRAFALSCDEIRGLLNAGVSDVIVVTTIASAAPPPTTADLKCLEDARAPLAVLNAVRLLNGLPAQERRPAPAPAKPVAPTVLLDPPEPAVRRVRYYDCLGGICLDALERSPLSPVTVVLGERYTVYREVEVCGQRVARVVVTRGFALAGMDLQMPSPTVGDLEQAKVFLDYLVAQLSALGWEPIGHDQSSADSVVSYWARAVTTDGDVETVTLGRRLMLLETSVDSERRPYMHVTLASYHPDYQELCAKRDASGL